MNLEFDAHLQQLQGDWRRFADSTLAPFAEKIDQTGELSEPLLTALRESNLLKPFLPKDQGGEDLDLMALTLLLEEVARISPALGILVAQQVILGIRTATRHLVHPDKAGLAMMAATFDAFFSIAATEVSSGSDLTNLASICRKNPDGTFALEGGKAYVNWANRAACIFVLARVDEANEKNESGESGSSFFALLPPQPGLNIGRVHKTMGLGGIEAAPLEFKIDSLPGHCLMGVNGFGREIYDRVMNELRIAMATIATGMAQQAFDDAAAHAKSRKQFGKPVGSFQSLQWRFADAATRIDASRLHVWRAVEISGQKHLSAKQAAMAKVYATESAFFVTDFAVQVMGSRGFMLGSRVERLFRDSRFFKIGHGTSEVLRNLVASQL